MTSNSTETGGTMETVLVVEGEILIRMAVSEYLRDCGYRVIEAANAEEAITVLQQPDMVVDVVLSDAEMPGPMDGFALAKWMREHRPGIDVLLAGTPSRAATAAGDLCDQGPMLSKPYDPQVVVDRIRRLLAERDSRK